MGESELELTVNGASISPFDPLFQFMGVYTARRAAMTRENKIPKVYNFFKIISCEFF
jgi:hypothetical protein